MRRIRQRGYVPILALLGAYASAFPTLAGDLLTDTMTVVSNVTQQIADSTNSFAGPVGIGTAAPAEKLHVVGNAKVEGTVTATGLVQTDGTTSRRVWVHGDEEDGSALASETAYAAYGAVSLGEASFAASDSVAVGANAYAPGALSTSVGREACAEGGQSIAMGSMAYARGASTVSVGNQSKAWDFFSVALGSYASATGSCSVAVGHASAGSGMYSTALGASSRATNYMSTAVGCGAVTTQDYEICLGKPTTMVRIPGQLQAAYVPAQGDLSMGVYTNAP